MTISTPNNINQKKCELCGSNRTDIINKEGTLVYRWPRNPYRKGTWMCGNCYRRRVYLKDRDAIWYELDCEAKRKRNKMSNNPSSNTDEKKCEYCGADKTYIDVTKKGTPYPKWNSNPFKEDTWICGRCYRDRKSVV